MFQETGLLQSLLYYAIQHRWFLCSLYLRQAIFAFGVMADNNAVFRMLAAEDKLDGTNYPLWAYMMCHVLVAKGL